MIGQGVAEQIEFVFKNVKTVILFFMEILIGLQLFHAIKKRDRDRQTDRQTQTDRKIDRPKQTERQTD